MASSEQLTFNEPHTPQENAIKAFSLVASTIKQEIIKSRRHWNQHEERMWARSKGLSESELTSFTIEDDLVEVRSAATSYGNIILGKIRIPGINDERGEGFVHVRIHDPPNQGSDDVRFHSLLTDEIRTNPGEQPQDYQAIQTDDKPLQFFNE